jgi:hypothetical protein
MQKKRQLKTCIVVVVLMCLLTVSMTFQTICVKTISDNYINSLIVNQIIDFNEDDYGYGPMVFLEGYLAILGAGNEDDYVEHLVNAIKGEKLNEAAEIETYYYLKILYIP